MAFVVEDGTGLSNATSLASVAEFDSYFTDRGNADAVALTEAVKESLLIKGADYLKTVYYGAWEGEKLVETQALPFPRVVDTITIFPNDIKYANIELALRANTSDLLADLGQTVISEKIDVIEVEYSEYSSAQTQYSAVSALVRPYLTNTSSFSHSVVRT